MCALWCPQSKHVELPGAVLYVCGAQLAHRVCPGAGANSCCSQSIHSRCLGITEKLLSNNHRTGRARIWAVLRFFTSYTWQKAVDVGNTPRNDHGEKAVGVDVTAGAQVFDVEAKVCPGMPIQTSKPLKLLNGLGGEFNDTSNVQVIWYDSRWQFYLDPRPAHALKALRFRGTVRTVELSRCGIRFES